jgi:hypothetical protein
MVGEEPPLLFKGKRMSEFEIWVYRGAIVILLGVLWYLAKGVLKQLKEINISLRDILIWNGGTDIKIKDIEKETSENKQRLNEHGRKIRDLELNQEGCPVCKEAKFKKR